MSWKIEYYDLWDGCKSGELKKLLLDFQILKNPFDPAKKVEMENSSDAENFQSRLH